MDYTVESGKIILKQSDNNEALKTSGKFKVVVRANYFLDSIVTQEINLDVQDYMILYQDIITYSKSRIF